ncbi:hypothetical protein DDZ18_11615 [Marinicauda salina]|uniref:Uncharacterized protein n=1 Tax=Marinicauda salina TaxID=2135793 RepID=A0A2U2BS66_9PROT|nr:hypothetical protein [Marinicauda salina]PWE16832.1 hypothetical protein DDZ18_11615 [Marinicauda salina]
MKHAIRHAAAALAAAIVSACGSIDGGPLIRPGEPTGVLEVANGSSRTFSAILISDCDNFTYGFNRLPDGVRVPPGSSYRFRVSAGCWDVDAGLAYQEARFRTQVYPGRLTRHVVVDPD